MMPAWISGVYSINESLNENVLKRKWYEMYFAVEIPLIKFLELWRYSEIYTDEKSVFGVKGGDETLVMKARYLNMREGTLCIPSYNLDRVTNTNFEKFRKKHQ